MSQRCFIAALLVAACSSQAPYDPGSVGGGKGGSGGSGTGGGGGVIAVPPIFVPNADAGAKRDANTGIPFPTDFTQTESGGYKLGPPPSPNDPGGGNTGTNCNVLVGLVRDVKGAMEAGGHPDFESYNGGRTLGLVGATVGADKKPVYGARCDTATPDRTLCPGGRMVTSKAAYDQWYRNTDPVNKPFLLFLSFKDSGGGIFTFESKSFFPLDGAGFGNSGMDAAGRSHNFHFTTELHTRFKYSGGERFTFAGDDDLWVFINGKLAMDIGGVHGVVSDTIDLDASAAKLGIAKGSAYSLDLFHAERHTKASNFRVDTNFEFVDCGVIIP